MDTVLRRTPVCGFLSLALTTLAIPFAYFASALFDHRPPSETVRVIVLFSKMFLLLGVVLGIVALVRRERLRWLPVIGWVLVSFTIGMFVHLDQDG
jgi:hypothetical protein